MCNDARLRCLAAVVVCLAWHAPALASSSVDVDAGVFHDDNLTRAHDAADRRSDRALAGGIAARYAWLPSGYDAIGWSAYARGETYDRYGGLDHAMAGMTLRYRRKLGLGRDAWVVALAADASYADYRENVRDGARVVLEGEIGRRFGEAFAARIRVVRDRRHARTDIPIVPGVSGEIFDLAGMSIEADADYAIDARWQASGRIGMRRGDVESTSRRNRAIFLASSAIADDPAFHDPELFGYRLRGTTRSAALAVSYALDDRASVNVGYRYDVTRVVEGVDYRSRVVDASLAVSF